MKTIKYIIMSVVMLFGFASCNDYLEVYEENVEPTDLYWSSKADVEATLSAGYWYLRNSVETYLIPWGELRAGCLFNRSGSPLQTYQIKSTTNITTWSPMYQIINSANLVLKNCDLARSNDATYTQEEMNSHKCEAYWLRALAYFYIVRNWRDAPLFTEPFETDEISYNVAKSSETEIIAQIKADLEEANPNDIETIEVLKDAASTAVYGTAGANGVLLITKKKGAMGKTNFTFSTKNSLKIEPKSMPMLNGNEYVAFVQDAIWNAANARGLAGQSALLEYLFDTPEINYNQEWRYFDEYNQNVNWLDYITKNAFTTDNSFAMSGGGERATYRFSLAYSNEGGTTKGTGLGRLTTSLDIRLVSLVVCPNEQQNHLV